MAPLFFGAWQPDIASLNSRDQAGKVILSAAQNVYPSPEGYAPIPSLATYQTGAALPTACKGIFAARTSVGGAVIFAGTTTKIYKFNSAGSSWDDYTRTAGGNYAVPTNDYWTWTQFGSKVIACNIADDPQVIDIDTGATNFQALGGSPPKARYVGVVGDFVFLACLGSNPRKVRNSAINDTAGWTVGTNLCDEQELPDGNDISGFAGGEFGWTVQQNAIRRAIFQPGFDQAFRFERVERERGASGIYSVAAVRDTIFFLASDGFYSMGPAGLRPIGHHRINDWFRANSDSVRAAYIYGFSDQTGPRVMWAVFGSSSATYPDLLLIYDWDIDQWSYARVTAQMWGRGVTAAFTLEGLNVYGSIDYPAAGVGPGLPYSLDSPAWQGGTPLVTAITSNGFLAFLNGTMPLDAQLVTSPVQFYPNARANVSSSTPIGSLETATTTLDISRLEYQAATARTISGLTVSPRSGEFKSKASGRLHRFTFNITQASGATWEHIIGLDVTTNQAGG